MRCYCGCGALGDANSIIRFDVVSGSDCTFCNTYSNDWVSILVWRALVYTFSRRILGEKSFWAAGDAGSVQAIHMPPRPPQWFRKDHCFILWTIKHACPCVGIGKVQLRSRTLEHTFISWVISKVWLRTIFHTSVCGLISECSIRSAIIDTKPVCLVWCEQTIRACSNTVLLTHWRSITIVIWVWRAQVCTSLGAIILELIAGVTDFLAFPSGGIPEQFLFYGTDKHARLRNRICKSPFSIKITADWLTCGSDIVSIQFWGGRTSLNTSSRTIIPIESWHGWTSRNAVFWK